MIRHALLAVAATLMSIGLTLNGRSPAAATDDYTLPFYNPGVTLSYGVDRDSRAGRQLDWTGQLWLDTQLHPGRVYDQHTGLDYPMALYSEIAAAKGGTVLDVEGGFGTRQWGSFGNFVLLGHPDGRRTLYYHLAAATEGGIGVSVGQSLSAGARVGLSGCSGQCLGAHLHFQVLRSTSTGAWTFTDPLFDRRWTTWPGRVPFLASYVRESNAGTEVIRTGVTITHWVEFRNDGGRTWLASPNPGRLVLGTWSPAAHSSPFRAFDWSSAWLATVLDQVSVAPDGVGRFTFGLHGGPAPGNYSETFNLYSLSVRWFDHARLGSFYVPIVISNLLE